MQTFLTNLYYYLSTLCGRLNYKGKTFKTLGYVKTLLTSRLIYHEDALRLATLEGDTPEARRLTSVVLELKRALELLYDSGEF